jgi:hypothetical protein
MVYMKRSLQSVDGRDSSKRSRVDQRIFLTALSMEAEFARSDTHAGTFSFRSTMPCVPYRSRMAEENL